MSRSLPGSSRSTFSKALILWVLAAMQGAGAQHTVVLRANAVNYAVTGQGAPEMCVGEWKQTQVPKMDRDVADLIEKRKMTVYVIEEDLAQRGVDRTSSCRASSCSHDHGCPGSARSTRWYRSGRRRSARLTRTANLAFGMVRWRDLGLPVE